MRLRSAALFVVALACVQADAAPVSPSSPAVEPPVGWWRDAVFYEIFVRSFADASTGPLAGDGIGDFQGLIERLDYLNDGRGEQGHSLGVTALWLMPIHPSPSYHGYDVSDYFAVHPEFGDVALFRRFVTEAHRRGIRVIIDFVLNHASSQHPFFRAAAASREAKERAFFRFAPLPEQLVGPWEQRAWHPAGEDFYYGVFSSEMPDWNLENEMVNEHHRRAARFWLEEMGVDGFRLDAVRYFIERGEELQDNEPTRRWLRDFTAYCHRVKPGAFIVGENTAHSPEIARGIRGESVDSSFEFDQSRALLEAIRLQTPGILTQQERLLETLYSEGAPWSSFLTNHDQDRISDKLDHDPAKVRLAAKLLFAVRGVPFIYYGDELGMAGAKPDPELRTPMPWTGERPHAGFTRKDVRPWHAVTPGFEQKNVAAAERDPQSLLQLYRRLIRLNQGSPALRAGTPAAVETEARPVYAALRTTGQETVLVLANFSNAPVRNYRLSVTASPLRGGETAVELIEGAAIAAPSLRPNGAFSDWKPVAELPPYAVYVVRWGAR